MREETINHIKGIEEFNKRTKLHNVHNRRSLGVMTAFDMASVDPTSWENGISFTSILYFNRRAGLGLWRNISLFKLMAKI